MAPRHVLSLPTPAEPLAAPAEPLAAVLGAYDEPLLRQVAGWLLRPRGHWPAADLIRRCLRALADPQLLARRLARLDPACRAVLSALSHSRQLCWPVNSLVELALALGAADGLAALRTLWESGLLFPQLAPGQRCASWHHWWAQGHSQPPRLFTLPAVAEAARQFPLPVPELAVEGPPPETALHEADGLDWLLRLAVLWQRVQRNPLRRTQQGDLFKRDLESLRKEPLLNPPVTELAPDLPEVPLLVVALGTAVGVLDEQQGELRAGSLPASWEEGLPAALAELFASLPLLARWDPLTGGQLSASGCNPFPAAGLLLLLLLARLSETAWASLDQMVRWVETHHPFWTSASRRELASSPVAGPSPAPLDDGGLGKTGAAFPDKSESETTLRAALGLRRWLLGLLFPLRLLQATPGPAGDWYVRLSPLGRWLLGRAEPPPELPHFPQTLLVQPNLEVLAYRQGLTPALLTRLSRFALWKSLGPACTLQLTQEQFLAGLQTGESLEGVRDVLHRHSGRPVPASVDRWLQTWADQRERLRVYSSATVLEFASPQDLEEALARGLPALRLSDCLAVVANEEEIDFRQFRLLASRDYTRPPECCLRVAADGVTLYLDLGRADLLVASELARFAVPLPDASSESECGYRLTPATLAAARRQGLTLTELERWFLQRSGQPLPPAVHLLWRAAEEPAPTLEQYWILRLASATLADGLEQWPETRALLAERLGPTCFAVLPEQLPTLHSKLRELGWPVPEPADAPLTTS